MRDEDVAWAAGFFCGEGTTYVRRRKSKNKTRTYVGLCLRITQCGSAELLHRFRAIFGVGSVGGPYAYKGRLGKKPVFTFACVGPKDVKQIVDAMWPHLGTEKRTQALKAISEYKKGWIGIKGRIYRDGAYKPYKHLILLNGNFVSKSVTEKILSDPQLSELIVTKPNGLRTLKIGKDLVPRIEATGYSPRRSIVGRKQ